MPKEKRWWIKLWTKEWLDGTIRFDLTPEERSIWVDLLALAGDSRVPGIIQSGKNSPFPHSYLASRLQISVDLFETTIAKLISQQRISENNEGIHILNWDKYQAKYAESEGTETKRYKKQKQAPDISPREYLEKYGKKLLDKETVV